MSLLRFLKRRPRRDPLQMIQPLDPREQAVLDQLRRDRERGHTKGPRS